MSNLKCASVCVWVRLCMRVYVGACVCVHVQVRTRADFERLHSLRIERSGVSKKTYCLRLATHLGFPGTLFFSF